MINDSIQVCYGALAVQVRSSLMDMANRVAT